MKFTVDKFESEYAIVELEDKALSSIPLILLPQDAKEGDVLEISINIEETKKRKTEAQALIGELFQE